MEPWPAPPMPTTGSPAVRRTVVAALVVFVGVVAIVVVAGLVAAIVEGERGVDPHERLRILHTRLTAAGITCGQWATSTPSGQVVPTIEHATCTLADGGVLRVTAFRENRDKYRPGPCPRLELDDYWIDVAGVRDQALVQRLVAALHPSAVSDCTAST